MNKSILTLVFALLIGPAFSQKKKTETSAIEATSPKDSSLFIAYSKASAYGDYEAAKNAVYLILAKDASNLAWQDTLIRLYFSMGAYVQSLVVGTDYLAVNGDNYEIMEYVAASNYSLKRHKEALTDYETLFKHSKSPYHAYQLAINQYMVQRYGECESSIQFILADFASEKAKVLINNANGNSQQINMKAAAWNLRGVVQKDIGKTKDAQICFEQALKLDPEFSLAKGNLESLLAQEKAATKEEVKPKK